MPERSRSPESPQVVSSGISMSGIGTSDIASATAIPRKRARIEDSSDARPAQKTLQINRFEDCSLKSQHARLGLVRSIVEKWRPGWHERIPGDLLPTVDRRSCRRTAGSRAVGQPLTPLDWCPSVLEGLVAISAADANQRAAIAAIRRVVNDRVQKEGGTEKLLREDLDTVISQLEHRTSADVGLRPRR